MLSSFSITWLLLFGILLPRLEAFAPNALVSWSHPSIWRISASTTTLRVFGVSNAPSSGLTKLPKGISPFEKSKRDVQKELRVMAESAIVKGWNDGRKQLEIEFPPLLGGEDAKSQFDDFDNVQELNKNRDWCVELLPSLAKTTAKLKNIWFILPDLKEVELCKDEWAGRRYRDAGSFTSIEAVTQHYANKSSSSGDQYSKPWGASFAGFANQLIGGDSGPGLLGDWRALDALEDKCDLHLGE
jgi:hypothetical protein